jgi:hypothetical protein
MRCPNCGLVNPDTAQRCDCGYDFPSRTMKAKVPATASPAPAEAAPWALELIGALLLMMNCCQSGVTYSWMPISAGAYAATILAPAMVGLAVLAFARFLPGGKTRRGRARLFAGLMFLLFLVNCGIWAQYHPPSGSNG